MGKNISLGKLIKKGVSGISVFCDITKGEAWQRVAEKIGIEANTLYRWGQGYVPSDLFWLDNIIEECVHNGRMDAHWVRSVLRLSGYSGSIEVVEAYVTQVAPDALHKLPNILISYDRREALDQEIAIKLQNALQDFCHRVFLEEDRKTGEAWAERTETILDIADFVIVLLSDKSAHSNVIFEQLKMVADLEIEGVPTKQLLPVGINCAEVANNAIGEYLNELPWALFLNGSNDYSLVRIMAQLKSAITRVASLPYGKSERIDKRKMFNNLRTQSDKPYLRRKGDEIVDQIIGERGSTITVKGSRELGKTWLINRVINQLNQQQLATVRLDMQKYVSYLRSVTDISELNRKLCYEIAEQRHLNLDNLIEDLWERQLVAPIKMERFIEGLFKHENEQIFLFLDNADALLQGTNNQRNDFFAMLRGWHENRGSKHVWDNLTLIVAISTEPWLLIEDLDQSPFNVGTTITLQDFKFGQTQQLNAHYNEQFAVEQLQQLYDLVSGHPYLTHLAIRTARYNDDLGVYSLNHPIEEDSMFADHLRSLFLRLQRGGEELIDGMRQVVKKQQCDDIEVYQRLRSAGLVRGNGREKRPRCLLYELYFREYLD